MHSHKSSTKSPAQLRTANTYLRPSTKPKLQQTRPKPKLTLQQTRLRSKTIYLTATKQRPMIRTHRFLNTNRQPRIPTTQTHRLSNNSQLRRRRALHHHHHHQRTNRQWPGHQPTNKYPKHATKRQLRAIRRHAQTRHPKRGSQRPLVVLSRARHRDIKRARPPDRPIFRLSPQSLSSTQYNNDHH